MAPSESLLPYLIQQTDMDVVKTSIGKYRHDIAFFEDGFQSIENRHRSWKCFGRHDFSGQICCQLGGGEKFFFCQSIDGGSVLSAEDQIR